MKLPKTISKLIDSFERLPGIGPKSAQRLTFYLMNLPQEELEKFASSLSTLKKDTRLCSTCKNVSEDELCTVCSDLARNKKKILVVSSILDTFAVEKTGYDGVYHVLHGVIDPLNNIGPEEIFINELIERIKDVVSDTNSALDSEDINFYDLEDDASSQTTSSQDMLEVILATSSSLEGESTAMYLTKLIRENGFTKDKVKITRIARGIPVGGDIEYADDITLSKALEGRSVYQY